ncbi:hypothetical protein Aph02nite_04420 [Actinoplanes philippinensis]|uniref:Uncharacterized protein n=1 Tax=Actinoplanes philippinensis TaxID=35752 RepID=A0A1I2D427_9ACTN|nr:hypothetical protein [Actinoplanes philippinensis]GIE74492.1 hypothetical protein Aph02nite_04420 [Actinoplanes philippinensis]SFE75254.1 hypothetical protein SAMN05421541_103393 [Actinoplanes philippinensis]
MTTPDLPEPTERTEAEVRLNRLDRRRDKIRREIQENREGNHRVPTWVLALILVLFVAGWAYLILSA